jgi:plasmid stabilization system protein ParE
MSYRLVIVEPAEIDVNQIYGYLLPRSPQGAYSWYRAFQACLERITLQPLACSIAPENAEFEFEIRQALFKTKHGTPYRCVFTVVAGEVRILRVRGPGQAPLKTSDIGKH